MNELPDEQTCLVLLTQAGCSPEVIRHCKAVRDVALRIAKHADADIDLVNAGALLHDIGRSKTHTISHGVQGAKIAKKLELPEPLIHIIERHVGAGLNPDDAVHFRLPRKNYEPQTLEEKIVCQADNLIDDYKQQPIEAEVEKALLEGKHDLALKIVKLHKELSDICGIDLNKI